MVFFKNFCFSACFFFCQNSDSLKLVQLFDWKWVNRLDSIRGSLFFGQIPSFRPGKWHFFENYHFSALFFFPPEFRFTQICEAFEVEMGQQPRLQRRFIVFSPNSVVSAFEIAFFPKFPFRCSALFFLRQNSSSNKLVQLFDWK